MTTHKSTHSEPPAFTEHPTQSPAKTAAKASWRVIDGVTGVDACDVFASEAAARAEALRLGALAMDAPRYTVVSG